MNLDTKYFGKIEIDEKNIINFDKGLPGFTDYKQFVILQEAEQNIFMWLQSIDNTNLALAILDVFCILPEYNPDFDDLELKNLEIFSEEEFSVYVVINVSQNIEESTINLKAPIVINKNNKKGEQLILNNNYEIKYKFIKHIKNENS